MIDEELYQQAADELNSDRRRANVWDRACALSKNDHDEARYLYTNLRAEELMADRDAGLTSGNELDYTDSDSTLSLDSSEFDLSAVVQTGDHAHGLSADDTLSLSLTESMPGGQGGEHKTNASIQKLSEISPPTNYSTASHQRTKLEQQSDAQTNSENWGNGNAPVSSIEKDYYEHRPDQLADRDSTASFNTLERNHEELNMLLDGANTRSHVNSDTGVLAANFTDPTIAEPVLIDDELEWFKEEDSDRVHQQQVSPPHPAHQQNDQFTQELLRQADESSGQHSDVVASNDFEEDVTWEPSPMANEAAVGTAAAIGAARYGKQTDTKHLRYSGSTTQNSHHADLPIDLTDGTSTAEFSIYKRKGSVQAVKKGGSWLALFFTFPYLVYRQLFGTAIVYAVMTALLLAGLAFFGLNWLDGGATATTQTKLFAAGFAFLTFVGLFYLPFRYGNLWRTNKLERRGYELVAHVNAGSPGRAIARARRASALD